MKSLIVMILIISQNLQADCEGSGFTYTDSSQKALRCEAPSGEQVTFCFDGGFSQKAEESRTSGNGVSGKIKIRNQFSPIRLRFTSFGFEPGMYKGESESSIVFDSQSLDISLSIDAWGPSTIEYHKSGSKIFSGNCRKISADSSTETFSEAARAKDWPRVETMIQSLTDPNAEIGDGNTPLTAVIGNAGPLTLVKLLLDKGANPNTPDATGSVPMSLLGVRGMDLADYVMKLYPLLISHGADVNSPGFRGHTVFMLEVRSMKLNSGDKTRIVRYLKSQGANPNAVNVNGENAMFQLSGTDEADYISNAKVLIELGVEPNLKNTEGQRYVDQIKKYSPEKFPNLIPFLESLPQK